MKIVVTGSLGPISKPLTEKLIAQGHQVTVVSSKADRQQEIEALGGRAAIGTIEDVDFLTTTFTGADAAYLMEPTINLFDHHIDIYTHYSEIAEKYVRAIRRSGLKRIVHLSSIGGHSDTGTGMLAFHYHAEQTLKQLPESVAITTLRPSQFYSNIMAYIPTIKALNAIVTSYEATDKEPWVAPADIATVAAEELGMAFQGRKIRYIVSDELTSAELVRVLGNAIGRDDLKWVTIPGEELEKAYVQAGMSLQAARGFVRLNEAKQSGTLYDDIQHHEPARGIVKMDDYALIFARSYHQS